LPNPVQVEIRRLCYRDVDLCTIVVDGEYPSFEPMLVEPHPGRKRTATGKPKLDLTSEYLQPPRQHRRVAPSEQPRGLASSRAVSSSGDAAPLLSTNRLTAKDLFQQALDELHVEMMPICMEVESEALVGLFDGLIPPGIQLEFRLVFRGLLELQKAK